jgi:hypothetical protein
MPFLDVELRCSIQETLLITPLKLSTKTKHYHRERVRSLLVQNPHISGEGIRRHLETQGLILDRHYISSLVNAIHAERAKRASTWMLNHASASFQDAMSEIVKAAWEIVNDPMAKNQDKVMAMREIREAYNVSFEKLFDAGVFERKLGTLDATIRNTPLPDNRKQAIRSVFENWGLLNAPKEDVKPAEPTATP